MMRICKIYIHDFQQFKDFTLDLTDPNGEPLEKVCLIGRNGTGKTTLLRILATNFSIFEMSNPVLDFTFGYIKYKTDSHTGYRFKFGNFFGQTGGDEQNKIFETYNWATALTNYQQFSHKATEYVKETFQGFPFSTVYQNGKTIHAPEITSSIFIDSFSLPISQKITAEDKKNKGLPKSSVANALTRDDNRQKEKIGADSANDFWTILLRKFLLRNQNYAKFLEKNEDKTVRELREIFDAENPKILEKIGALWNKILEKSGLELDLESINAPALPYENLEMFIRNKYTKETIPYYALSEGIRNFIFKVGHLYSLYFNREIENGFVFYDEPETSLHADFLYDFVSEYLNFMTNTQLFIATHSEIIASQFEPYERVILEYDRDDLTRVRARKGIAPIGDDPNDVLKKDFNTKVHNRHPKAKDAWNRYLELSELIANNEADKTQRKAWVQEYLQIGQAYNFPEPQNLSE